MISLDEARSRWKETFKHGSGIADLQRAVKSSAPNSPCAAGLRSICWKAFLLWRTAPSEQWPELARKSRASYAAMCEQHLRFIRHPEQLAALTVDPLADDPDSPWDALRRDETVRAEIRQDVCRLPDEPFYHEERVQTMILDILFLYCKLNPGLGGYRQGMHELLAPIVSVVAQDALSRSANETSDSDDALVIEMLDSEFVEHDAFALFSKLMESAGSFYEVASENSTDPLQKNSIVERSRYIHEVALMKVDEELANHLRSIEVLPQIFLIRWIRLLYGREFPFGQLLTLWDTLFAYDPNLELIDLICVAMLLRIRWTLLEMDYSNALQLMLKYPTPPPPNGPHTFVDDALYLKTHLDAAGGVHLIFKYTGKCPTNTKSTSPPARSTASSPPLHKFNSFRQRTLGARSPLSVSARILQNPGSVEALLQGAAKNVMERSEKLGINQAVRDAVGEIRRNIQEARSSTKGFGDLLGDNGPPPLEHALTVTMMERRNHRLAAMLDESIMNLKLLIASGLGGDKAKHLETVETARAKLQFVKASLEDPSLSLPEEELPALNNLSLSSPTETRGPTVALDTTPVVMTSAVEETRSALSSPESGIENNVPTSPPKASSQSTETLPAEPTDKMDTDPPELDTVPPLLSDVLSQPPALSPTATTTTITKTTTTTATNPPSPTPPSPTQTQHQHHHQQQPQRPSAPIPTRSTLAQSSFAWMLEPDTTSSSLARAAASPSVLPDSVARARARASSSSSKRGSQKPGRERHAFLFGEVTPPLQGLSAVASTAAAAVGGSDGGGRDGMGKDTVVGAGGGDGPLLPPVVSTDQIFGLRDMGGVPRRRRRGTSGAGGPL
ncbi:hypothetical protein VTK26DRAFT_8285 [Humicola hyalothermophila]